MYILICYYYDQSVLKLIVLGTSEESKQHSREVLDNEFNGGDVAGSGKSDEDKNPNNM